MNVTNGRYSYFMELVTDPFSSNTICQEAWNQTHRLIYGGFTNMMQVPHRTGNISHEPGRVAVCGAVQFDHHQLHQHHDEAAGEKLGWQARVQVNIAT